MDIFASALIAAGTILLLLAVISWRKSASYEQEKLTLTVSDLSVAHAALGFLSEQMNENGMDDVEDAKGFREFKAAVTQAEAKFGYFLKQLEEDKK